MPTDPEYQEYLDYLAWLDTQPAEGPVEGAAPGEEHSPSLQRAALAGVVAPVAGLAQKGTGLLEALSVLPEGSTEAVTNVGNSVQAMLQGATNEQLSGPQRFTKGATSFATEMAVPGGVLMKGAKAAKGLRGLGKVAAAGTAAGTVGAATHFDPEAEAAWENVAGLGLGAGLGAITGPLAYVPAGVRNKVLKMLREPPTPESARLLREIRKSKIWKTAEERLTLGQKTGDPRIEQQEALVRSRLAVSVENRQLEAAERRVLQMIEEGGGPAKKEISALGEDLRKALANDRVLRLRARTNEYGRTLDAAEALAKADPADAFGVKVSNFFDELRANDVSRSQWQVLANSAPEKYRPAVQEALDVMNKNQGRMGLGDMMKVHQALNEMRRSLSRAEQAGATLVGPPADMNRFAKGLQDALERDMAYMDAAVDAAREATKGKQVAGAGFEIPGLKYQEAWQMFKGARARYADHMKDEAYLNAQIIEKQFGFSPKKPEEAMRTILAAPAKEQTRVIEALGRHFPETLRDIKMWKLKDALTRATDPEKPGAISTLNPAKLIKELTTEGEGVAGKLMWTPGELQDLKAATSYLRLIQSKSSKRDPGVEPSRISMALSSLSPPFVASTLYRLFASPKLEMMLFTEKGRKQLQNLATLPKTAPGYIAAEGYMASLLEGSATD